MTAIERELRRALAAPPVEEPPDAGPSLARVEAMVTRARRRRAAASALAVVAVLSFGVYGSSALTGVGSSPMNAGAGAAGANRAPVAASNSGGVADRDTRAYPQRKPPQAVLDAAKERLASTTGIPGPLLYYVGTRSGRGTVYLVQILLYPATGCGPCQDPAATPPGSSIEFRVAVGDTDFTAPPDSTYPGYSARATPSDLNSLGTVYSYPVPR